MAAIRQIVVMCGVFAWAALTTGCSRRISNAECTQMLDKYIEMTTARDGDLATLAEGEKAASLEMKRATRKADPRYAKVHTQCASEITPSEYKCAMKAETPERWESCIE